MNNTWINVDWLIDWMINYACFSGDPQEPQYKAKTEQFFSQKHSLHMSYTKLYPSRQNCTKCFCNLKPNTSQFCSGGLCVVHDCAVWGWYLLYYLQTYAILGLHNLTPQYLSELLQFNTLTQEPLELLYHLSFMVFRSCSVTARFNNSVLML